MKQNQIYIFKNQLKYLQRPVVGQYSFSTAITQQTATPRSILPQTATPHSILPQTATPHSILPQTATPRSIQFIHIHSH